MGTEYSLQMVLGQVDNHMQSHDTSLAAHTKINSNCIKYENVIETCIKLLEEQINKGKIS